MRKIIFTMLISCGLLGSASLMAAGSSGERTLKNVSVTSDSYVRLEATNNWNNPDACDSGKYIFIDPENDAFKIMTAAALTAFAAGSTVKIFVDGCYERNGDTYPILVTLNVIN